MAGTIIQIKRATVTASPSSLANGELAFSGNLTSNSLFIGSPDGSGVSIRIAGGAFGYLYQGVSGTLTANATLITDANSFVSNVKSSGLYLGPSAASPAGVAVNTINAVANSTVLGLASNTELTTTWAVKTYVDATSAAGGGTVPGGVNTDIQFNDSGLFAGGAGLTFNKTTSNVSIANTLSAAIGNFSTGANVGANVLANTSAIYIGNSTVYTTANSSVTQTGALNASVDVAVGANVLMDTTKLSIGNTT